MYGPISPGQPGANGKPSNGVKTMKQGRSLTELAQEIERRANAKADYLVDTNVAELAVYGEQGETETNVRLAFGNVAYDVNRIAHDQIAAHTGIPTAYYRKMLEEAPHLLANNVGEWFRKYPATRMVRTLDGCSRAFLSDRYRPLENEELAEAVLPVLADQGVEIMSCEITDRRLYIKAVDTSIRKDMPLNGKWGRDHHIFDTQSPAIIISNSEVGHGSLSVEGGIFTKVCTNLAIFGQRSMKKYHIGGKHDIDGIYHLLSDETRKVTDAAVWRQVQDVVKAALDQAKFDALIEEIAGTTEVEIKGDPVKAIERVQKKLRWTDDQRGSVLEHLVKGGDLSQYGLASAVTRSAQDFADYDDATDFERLGGKIIELGRKDFMELVAA